MPLFDVPTFFVTAGRELASRVVRQVLQALTPTLLVVAGGSVAGIDVWAVLFLALVTALVTIATYVLGFKVPAEAPVMWQLIDRAGKAAAGTAIGWWTTDGVVPAAEISWGPALTAIVGSAVLAAVMYFTNPPVVSQS